MNVSNGGFDLTNSALGVADQLFACRAGGGELMAIRIANDSSYTIWTKKRTLTLPIVDALSSNRDITSLTSLYTTTSVSNSQSMVVSIGVDGSRYIRNAVRSFSTGVVVPESVVINSPRAGFSNRLAVASVNGSDGQPASV